MILRKASLMSFKDIRSHPFGVGVIYMYGEPSPRSDCILIHNNIVPHFQIISIVFLIFS